LLEIDQHGWQLLAVFLMTLVAADSNLLACDCGRMQSEKEFNLREKTALLYLCYFITGNSIYSVRFLNFHFHVQPGLLRAGHVEGSIARVFVALNTGARFLTNVALEIPASFGHF
jgi:hypothetical protein